MPLVPLRLRVRSTAPGHLHREESCTPGTGATGPDAQDVEALTADALRAETPSTKTPSTGARRRTAQKRKAQRKKEQHRPSTRTRKHGLALIGCLAVVATGLALTGPRSASGDVERDSLLGRGPLVRRDLRKESERPGPPEVGLRTSGSRPFARDEGASLEPGLLRDLIALGTEDLGSAAELEELVLAVALPFARLEAAAEALVRGLLTTSEERLTPAERGALRALVLGAHLHREPSADGSPHREADAAWAKQAGQMHAEVPRPGGGARVAALLERTLVSAPGWTEPLRERFAQLATSLLGNGRCCLETSHAETLLAIRAEDARLASWCDRLLACALGRHASGAGTATARAWLETPPGPEAVGPALRALFATGADEQAWALADAVWSEHRGQPGVRAGLLQAVASAAPLPGALGWLESRASAGDVGASLALASRPGAQQAALERYGELLAPSLTSGSPEAELQSDEARSRARRVMVSALTDPRLLTDLACTDPAPAVRSHAHLTAAQTAGPLELQRLVAELQREHLLGMPPEGPGHEGLGPAPAHSGPAASTDSSQRLSADARALIALTHARRAARVGARELEETCLQLAEHLLESGHLGHGTATWLQAALGSQH